MVAHSEACIANEAVRYGPAGEQMDRAVCEVLMLDYGECACGCGETEPASYSQTLHAAWRALGMWCSDSNVLALDVHKTGDDFYVFASGVNHDGSEWDADGVGDTMPIAICRAILNQDLECAACGEPLLVPPDIQAQVLQQLPRGSIFSREFVESWLR